MKTYVAADVQVHSNKSCGDTKSWCFTHVAQDVS